MKRLLAIVAGLVGLALLGALAWVWQFVYAPVPVSKGQVRVEGLTAPADILQDERGVLHIFAQSIPDLLFAQGYAHAQTRWFTMDFYRRIARGELAGLIGADADVLANDRLMRSLDLAGLAEEDYRLLDAPSREAIEAFAAGVNAYIAERTPGALAVEYGVLELGGLTPQVAPWTAQDSLAVGRLAGFSLSGRDATNELRRAALRAAVGEALYAQWQVPYDYDRHPTVIAREDLPVMAMFRSQIEAPEADAAATDDPVPEGSEEASESEEAAGEESEEARLAPPLAPPVEAPPGAALRSFAFLERLGFGAAGAGSNSWAVSGARSRSGRPVLAVDPHNALEMPNFWHEIGLHLRNPDAPDQDIDIHGFAGAPFFLILEGSNSHAAWGTTNVTGGDGLDLFRLTLNPDNPYQYRWDDEWRPIEQETVMIPVAGGASVSHVIERTHFGPLLPLSESDPSAPRYAIRWGGFEPSAIARASLALPFIRSFEEMREALADWDFPATHFVYAGRDGHIGMQQAGRFPVRAPQADGSLPQDGSISASAWRGTLPYTLMPWVKNPASGVIATGNNPAVPAAYFEALRSVHGIEGEIDYLKDGARGYRGARITERLLGVAVHDRESFASIQQDVTVPGLARSLEPLLEVTAETPSPCRSALADWNGTFSTDSAGALVFATFWTDVLDAVYAPRFPEGLTPKVGMNQLQSLETILADPDSGWWDDPATSDREARDDRLPALLSVACTRLNETYGEDVSQWEWGKAHGAHFTNPVLDGSGVGLLKALGNRGPVPLAGGAGTVSIGRWRHGDGFNAVHIPGYRYVMDLGEPHLALVISSTGASSHPASAQYADQMDRWAQGAYDRVDLREDAIRASAKGRLRLTPMEDGS